MRSSVGVLFLLVGLGLLYLAITGRLANLPRAWALIKDPSLSLADAMAAPASGTGASTPAQQMGFPLGSTFGVPPSFGLPVPMAPLLS